MSRSERPPAEYWRDRHHDFIRVSFIDAAGHVIQETGSRNFPAPLNANATCPVQLRIEIGHDDGCTRLLQQIPLECW